MRLFVALRPPIAVVDAIAGRLQALPERFTASPDLRWVSAENWHVTLAFLGDVDPAVLDDLGERLGRVARRHAVLDLRIGRMGAFDRPAAARVVHFAVDGPGDGLRRLAWSVAAGARRARVDVDERKFRAHLTVARARRPLDVRPFVDAVGPLGTLWPADTFELVQSHLGGGSPRYETLASWTLRA